MRTPFKMNRFQKEIGLVILIIVTSVLPYFSNFFSETHNTINIFGFEFSHIQVDNQTFFHGLFNRILMIVFPLILFKVSHRRYRYALLFLLYWSIYRFFWIFINNDFVQQHVLSFQGAAMALVLLLFVKVRYIRRKIVMTFDLGVSDAKTSISDFLIASLILGVSLSQKVTFFYSWHNIKLSVIGFEISDYGFQNTVTFLWVLNYKISLLMMVSFCYFTQKQWWRYALLFPILLFVYEVRCILNPNWQTVSERELIEASPLLLGVLILLVFLSRAAYFQAKAAAIYAATYQKIEEVLVNKDVSSKEAAFIAKSKEKFNKIKQDKIRNLEELERLRNILSNKLDKADAKE